MVKNSLKFIIIFSLAVLFLVFLFKFATNTPPASALRIIFGWFLVMFLPGYLIIKIFFDYIDSIEKIAYSFGISIVIAVAIGLSLNWLWEISLFPILVLYFSFVMLALIGLVLKKLVIRSQNAV